MRCFYFPYNSRGFFFSDSWKEIDKRKREETFLHSIVVWNVTCWTRTERGWEAKIGSVLLLVQENKNGKNYPWFVERILGKRSCWVAGKSKETFEFNATPSSKYFLRVLDDLLLLNKKNSESLRFFNFRLPNLRFTRGRKSWNLFKFSLSQFFNKCLIFFYILDEQLNNDFLW